MKKYWECSDKEIKNITNDLIIKWKKITKAASENNKITKTSIEIVKPEISEIKTENIRVNSKPDEENKVTKIK